MQFALSAQADGGVVALSLAMAPTLQGKVRHVTLPEHLHQPLRQRMVRRLMCFCRPMKRLFSGWFGRA